MNWRGLIHFGLLGLLASGCGDSGGHAGQADAGSESGGHSAQCKSTSCSADAGGQESNTTGNGHDASTTPTVLGNGVGQACKTDDDCKNGLTCHVDTQEYIGHGQCTAARNSEEACTTNYGDDTMCIGANICTLKCRTDADCPAKTVCIDAGWCERTGPNSGNPYCTGVANSCALAINTTDCIGILGCSDNSACTGLADDCYSQLSNYSCISQDGCYWSSSSQSCSGVASSCSAQLGEYTCGSQQGCTWNFECSGVATACDTLAVSVCASQPGCTLGN